MKNSAAASASAVFLLLLLTIGMDGVACQFGPITCASLKNTLPKCTSSACEKFCLAKYQNYKPSSAITWECFGVSQCTCTLCHG
uniref:Uncharacterized protein n=1 Tax=Kalanchoe fedtschenkoi TaxID=63787 RepID=A0A7N0UX79_KALFE